MVIGIYIKLKNPKSIKEDDSEAPVYISYFFLIAFNICIYGYRNKIDNNHEIIRH